MSAQCSNGSGPRRRLPGLSGCVSLHDQPFCETTAQNLCRMLVASCSSLWTWETAQGCAHELGEISVHLLLLLPLDEIFERLPIIDVQLFEQIGPVLDLYQVVMPVEFCHYVGYQSADAMRRV